ncbi:hypothetical protein T484DRAFT_1844971 [Baffinella frigidus]|nr:hypothetical protein T484DRAFT_1844971 [Cryptophyta sp. CCMP2293]
MPRDEFAKLMGSVFAQYDVDNSGYLDNGEFENAVRNSGIPFSPDQNAVRNSGIPFSPDQILMLMAAAILMLMAAADANDDGQIQYGEFAEIQYGEFAEVAVQLMAYMQREAQIVAQMETIGEDGDDS